MVEAHGTVSDNEGGNPPSTSHPASRIQSAEAHHGGKDGSRVGRKARLNRPRMPTSLEKKLQDARVSFHKHLGISTDAERPTSPGTIHKLLAQLEAQEKLNANRTRRHKQPIYDSVGTDAPAPRRSPRRLSLQPFNTSGSNDQGDPQSPVSPSAAAAKAQASTLVTSNNTKRHAGSTAVAAATLAEARGGAGNMGSRGAEEPVQWALGGRGRKTPHMNINLSILPTATQQWMADKTLYYSPIGPMAGTAPHKFASTLREGMLMYFSPMKKAAALSEWAKMDKELQQDLLAQSSSSLSSLGPSDQAQRLNDNTLGAGAGSDLIGQRVHALASRLNVHPEALWELLDSELQPADAGYDSTDMVADVADVGVEEVEGQEAVSQQGTDAIAGLSDGHGGMPRKWQSRSRGRSSMRASGSARSARTRSHASLSAILRRAPVAVGDADGEDEGIRHSQNQSLIQAGLNAALHRTHTLKGSPLTTARLLENGYSTRPASSTRFADTVPITTDHLGAALSGAVHDKLHDVLSSFQTGTGAATGAHTSSVAAVDVAGDTVQASAQQEEGVYQPWGRDVVLGVQHRSRHVLGRSVNSTPLKSVRHSLVEMHSISPGMQSSTAQAPDGPVSTSVSRAATSGGVGPEGGLAFPGGPFVVLPSSPHDGSTAGGQRTSPVRVRSPGNRLFKPDPGTPLSSRYAMAAKADEWQPAAPGAVRPGTGQQWDYQTGVYNQKLADDVYKARQESIVQSIEAQVALQLAELKAQISQGTPPADAPPSPLRASSPPKFISKLAPIPIQPPVPRLPTIRISTHSPPRDPTAQVHSVSTSGMVTEDEAPRPPNARALRATVGRSILRRRAMQEMSVISQAQQQQQQQQQQARIAAAAAVAATSDGPPSDVRDAAYALAVELHALAKQFGVRLDRFEDGGLALDGDDRKSDVRDTEKDPWAKGSPIVHREILMRAEKSLRAALATPGVFEWDRLLMGERPGALVIEAFGRKVGPPGGQGTKGATMHSGEGVVAGTQPAGVLLAREIRRLRQIMREPHSPYSGLFVQQKNEIASGQDAQDVGGRPVASPSRNGNPIRPLPQQQAPMIEFESHTLAETRKVILQLQEVRSVQGTLWGSERQLVPLRQRQRKRNGVFIS